MKFFVESAPVSTSITSRAIGSKAARKCCIDLTMSVDFRVGSTPSVVVSGAENAAVELVSDGVNGVVAEHSTAESIGKAIVDAVRGGPSLRESTVAWFVEHAASLRIERSLEAVTRAYAGDSR